MLAQTHDCLRLLQDLGVVDLLSDAVSFQLLLQPSYILAFQGQTEEGIQLKPRNFGGRVEGSYLFVLHRFLLKSRHISGTCFLVSCLVFGLLFAPLFHENQLLQEVLAFLQSTLKRRTPFHFTCYGSFCFSLLHLLEKDHPTELLICIIVIEGHL